MKVLWLAPWFRTLAVAWADGLRERGHEVVVATTNHHFDGPSLHRSDVLFRRPWRSLPGLAEAWEARRYVHAFAPDVVVTELTRDPRFLALAPRSAPCVVTTHDAKPHDSANATPTMRRLSAAILERRAAAEVCFSDYVRREIGERSHPVRVVNLTSEMAEVLTPDFVPAEGRRDFLVVGRLSTYKNLPVVLQGYRLHQRSAAYRGDRLIVIGGGDPGCPVPSDIQWLDDRFKFAEMAPRLASAKASICLYSQGSQSGVQVWGAQCGVRTLVSDAGGLGEYLPPGDQTLHWGDPQGLAHQLDRLADPVVAAEDGARHRSQYADQCSVAITAAQWEATLLSALAR